MTTLSRKQREIEEREDLILEVASKMLVELGLNGLTMDRIAERIEYSKGTIYHHFSSKEDILAALAARNAERRGELFARAARFDGSTRERMSAIGAAYDILNALYPDSCQAETIFHASHIKAKMSEQSAKAVREAEESSDAVMVDLIIEAVECGDLPARDPETVHDLYFGLWALSWGAYKIVEAVDDDELAERQFGDPVVALRRNQERLLDGFGWKPLSHEYDFEATRERVKKEIFSEELGRLARER